MGDHYTKKTRSPHELTDKIFDGPIKHVRFTLSVEQLLYLISDYVIIKISGNFTRWSLLSTH